MSELPDELLALRAQLCEAIRREARRSARRRRAARIGLLGMACAFALSGSALAAGAVLGVIHLGGGLRAQRIAKVPASKGSSGEILLRYAGCHHGCNAEASYVYRVSGGHARRSFGGITCGRRAVPFRPRRIFVTSQVPLSHSQLRYAMQEVDGEGGGGLRRLPQGTTTIVKLCKERAGKPPGWGRGPASEPQRGVMREVGLSATLGADPLIGARAGAAVKPAQPRTSAKSAASSKSATPSSGLGRSAPSR